MNNALIYNAVIDKVLLKPKNIFKNSILIKNNDNNLLNKDKYKEDNNLFNTLDALAFDDIMNEIKNNNIKKHKKYLPILGNSKKKKRFNNNPLPRTASNFFMKKNTKI